MALDSATLESLIETKLTAAGFNMPSAPDTTKLAQAIAQAVVEHITSAASVTTSSGTYQVQ